MRPALLGQLRPEDLMAELEAAPSRALAARRLTELGMPTRRSEAYRYFGIEPLMEHDWERVEIPATGEIAATEGQVVITDGVVTALPESAELLVGCSDTVDLDGDHFDPLYYLGHLMSREIIGLRF